MVKECFAAGTIQFLLMLYCTGEVGGYYQDQPFIALFCFLLSVYSYYFVREL